MTDRLASLFESAVSMLPMSEARSLDLFTEITNYDESACDAWIGRIRCGDTDRVTLFRAWYSRRNFGQLSGSVQISMSTLNARIAIGGLYGDITYPVTSPLAITMGFAACEAAQGNYADAMEALEAAPVAGSEHLVAWMKAVVYGAAERWTDVIDQVKSAGKWPDKFLAGAAGVAHGVAAANLALFTEAERRLTEANDSPAGEACARAIAWYLAMARRSQGNESAAVALLEWLQTTHPEPKVAAALKDPSYRLKTTTAEQIASRADPWDPGSVVTDNSGRERLLAEAQAELDRQIGLTRVKNQIERYRAATLMARVRAAKGMKVAQPSKHMIFTGPPGTGKTTIARVVANILAGLGVIAEPKLVETSRKDFVAEYEGQSAVKTAKTIDQALGGVLFIDEAYALVQERDGRTDPFGQEALDTLLARMENDRDRLVVIIAGYSSDIEFDDPLQFYSRSIALGIVVAVLILAGAALLAYFKPQGKLGGTSLFTDRATNQLYVLLSGQLHPVYNLTSARLVLGNPANPATVKSSELSKLPMGQTVGIPGAPYATPVSAGSTSIWTLCDTVARADSTSPVVQTAVIAIPLEIDASIDPLQSHEAVLVSYQGETWIVTTKGRHAIDLTDRALTSSMGIPVTARPTPISEGMFNALPDMGPWQLPPIPAAGAPNSLGLPDDLVIGSVFQIHTDKGPQYYVVLPDGIAQVNATTAAALRATQAHGLVAPPAMVPSLVVRIAERVYPSPLPDEPLKIVSRPQDPALCWSWQRSAGDQSPQSTVLSGRHLPISPSAMNMGIKQIHGTATVYLDGGKFVALQSPDPRYTESMYYIDPQGVRYGVPNAETAKSLGLSSPQNAPWEIVRLLVDGPVLSKDAALLEHDTLPADPSPRKVPAGASGAP